MAYQPPNFISPEQIFRPSQGPSVAEGLAAVLRDFAEQKRQQKLAQQESERLGRREARQEDEARFARSQQQIQQQLQLRKTAQQEVGLLEGRATPTIPLPEGQMGPEAEVPRQDVAIPGVFDPMTGAPLLTPGAMAPRYREDVALEERTQAEAKAALDAASAGQRAAAVAQATQPFQIEAETRQEASRAAAAKEAAQVRREDRAERQAERAAERAAAAAQKKSVYESAVDEAASAIEGGAPANSVPIGLRSAAVNAARGRGARVFDTPQTKAKVTDYEEFRAKAARLKELLAKPEVQQRVGPIAGPLAGAQAREGKAGLAATALDVAMRGATMGAAGIPEIPPDVDEARTLMEDLSDAKLRQASGASTTEPEFARVKKFSTDPNGRLQRNVQNVDRMLDAIDARIATLTGQKPSKTTATSAPAPGGPLMIEGYQVEVE